MSKVLKSREEEAYMYFRDFLDDCKGNEHRETIYLFIIYFVYLEGDVECTLEDVLVFFTGSCCIPQLGFEQQAHLQFLHDSNLPTSSTCDLTLRLPACHRQYCSFKESMIMGIKNHNGFGNV